MKTSSRIFMVILGLVLTVPAMATGENTVTSKSYVDAQDALKQDKITAKTTGNVVTYNGTSNGQTQFDEVGIYDGSAAYSNSDADKLVTAEVVADFAAAVESITIPDNKLTCYNQNEGCTLWTISEGTVALTEEGTFAPLTAAATLPSCKGYGSTKYKDDVCCSGYLQSGNTNLCGCADDSDCPDNFKRCDTARHTCLE